MKAAVIIFHKNIHSYPKEWIDQCFDSIQDQTYKDYDVFEMDYGGGDSRSFPGSRFYSVQLPNYAHAQNLLIKEAVRHGYDCAFNVNIDDWYDPYRFEMQISMIQSGYDLVSSNFFRVYQDSGLMRRFNFSILDIEEEAAKGHNIIAHPVVCYSRRFMQEAPTLDPTKVPEEDFDLWKKCYALKKFKFVVMDDYLFFHRVHHMNISKQLT